MDFPSFLKMSFVSFSCPIGPKWMKRWRRLWSLRTPSTSAWTASTFAWKDPGSCCPSSNITGVLSAEELGVCVCVWCNLCLHTNLQLKGKTLTFSHKSTSSHYVTARINLFISMCRWFNTKFSWWLQISFYWIHSVTCNYYSDIQMKPLKPYFSLL